MCIRDSLKGGGGGGGRPFFDRKRKDGPGHGGRPALPLALPSDSKKFDFEGARILAARAHNLGLVRTHVFGGQTALAAAALDMRIERLDLIITLMMDCESGLAEHIERSLGLKPGWLDTWRDALTDDDLAHLRAALGTPAAAGLSEDGAPVTAAAPDLDPAPAPAPVAVAPIAATAVTAALAPAPADPAPAPAKPQTARAAALSADSARITLKAMLAAKGGWGAQGRLAEKMGADRNSLSAWLGGLRPLPVPRAIAMRAALAEIDDTLALQSLFDAWQANDGAAPKPKLKPTSLTLASSASSPASSPAPAPTPSVPAPAPAPAAPSSATTASAAVVLSSAAATAAALSASVTSAPARSDLHMLALQTCADLARTVQTILEQVKMLKNEGL